MSDYYARKMLKVIKSINEGDCKYSRSEGFDYFWYINAYNLMEFATDYGASIRGCWFSHSGQSLSNCWAFYDGEQITELNFTGEEFKEFINVLFDWSGLEYK